MPKAPKNWRNVGYILPTVIDPDENICICVPIPKDWGHVRAFLGQLTELSKWQTWEKDGTTNASLAARRWFEIVDCVISEVNCKMSGNCGCDDAPITNQRYTDDGHLEISRDGGETWENGDSSDPRFNSPVWIGIPGDDGDTKKCQAANAIITALKEQKDASSDIIGAGGTLIDILAAIATFAASTGVGVVVAALVAIVGAVMSAIVAAGQTIFDDSFGDETWSDLLCSLYCNMQDDGSFTVGGWQAVKSETGAGGEYPSNAWLAGMINSVGVVGLTNLGRSGRTGALDCSGCDCNSGCSERYVIGPIGHEAAHGTILSNDGTTIRVEASDGGNGAGYAILEAETLGECCLLTSVTFEGGATLHDQFRISCGTPYSEENWVNTEVTGGCQQLIQIQTQIGAVVVFTFAECP